MLWPVVSFFVSYLVSRVSSHGRLTEPPSRASMWRYGFNTPPNYNDHELYCGGFTRQWQVNGGKCGICGDPWEQQPRAHEAGGKYASGIIVRKYKAGSMFTIRVEVTANHRGHFEFRLCPNNKPKVAATQECLDKYVLRRGKTSSRDPTEDEVFHETWFYPGTENKVYEMRYMLPPDLTCTQCVLQWKYIAGNNWGMCKNGTGVVGCGPQEEFRACADIQITDGKGEADDTPYPTVPTVKPTRRPPIRPTRPTTPSETTTEEEYIDNEIPDDEEISKEYSDFALVTGITVLLALLCSVLILVGIYLYYYHVQKRELSLCTTALSCTSGKDILGNLWDKTKQLVSGKKVKEGVETKENLSAPVPPPRIKKNTTIGFKGVPDNLI